MGYSLSWLAFRGTAVEAGLQALGLLTTGSVGAWERKSVAGHALADGWHLVMAPRCDHPLVSESNLAVLSRFAEVIACRVEEHVMFSSAEFWARSEKRWCVEHDAQQGRRHLKTDGALPAAYAIALQQSEEQQDAEDSGPNEVDFYFDVPLQLASEMTGFKHDEEASPLDDRSFEVYGSSSKFLAEMAPRKWWQVWK